MRLLNCYTVTLLRLRPAAYQGLPNLVPNAVAKEDYLKRGTNGYCLEMASLWICYRIKKKEKTGNGHIRKKERKMGGVGVGGHKVHVVEFVT